MKKTAILILQWNHSSDTIECIRSVLKIQSPPFDLIIIDNGSRPDELGHVRNLFPDLCYVENGQNLGFAEGYNRGIAVAFARGAEYVLLLNNDTTVDPHLLTAFHNAATAHPDAGVFGAKIYFFDQPTDLWYAGADVHSDSLRCYHIGCGESDLEKRYESIRDTGYACGCALFVSKAVIETVGMMDPRFFLLWEEIDWCWRIRRGGYRCLFVPEAKVWHKISTSFEGGNRGPLWQYFYFRHRLLFVRKHLPIPKRFRFYITRLFPEIFHMLTIQLNPRTEQRTRQQYRSALRGICHGVWRQ